MKPNPRQIRRTTSCPLAIHIYIYKSKPNPSQINPNQAKPKLNEVKPKPNQAKTAIMKTISLAKIWQAIRNPWPVAGTKTISLAKIGPAAQNPRPANPTHNVMAPSYIFELIYKSKPNQAKREPNQTKPKLNEAKPKPNSAKPQPNQATNAIMKTISLAKIWPAVRNP